MGLFRRRSAQLMRSAGMRFALVYALLFGISAVTLILFLWWSTAGLLERQVDAAIRTDVQGLSERWQIGGLPALVETIQERLLENVDDDAIYLLADRAHHRVTGNLERWPAEIDLSGAPQELEISRAGQRGLARVQRFDLPHGAHLLVGRDVRVRARLRHLLTDAMLGTLGLTVALGGIGAVLVQGLFRRMLAQVTLTARAISAGDLSRRVVLSGRGDEFDRLARTINDMLDRIGRLMNGVRQVSNAIAHDLRTPITRARMRLEDAASHAGTETELRAAIERATGDLDAAVAVFQALLRIAEIEAGARRSAFATLDLVPLLQDLAELYGAVAEEGGLLLTLDTPPSLPIIGDREMIQQALGNLLDNAIKFSPAGGTVALRAGTEGGSIRLQVADAGPGIPDADRSRAAERFYRGEAARGTPGSGLGLALVQAVAQLHGGVLRLESAHPGLRAVLVLPGELIDMTPCSPAAQPAGGRDAL